MAARPPPITAVTTGTDARTRIRVNGVTAVITTANGTAMSTNIVVESTAGPPQALPPPPIVEAPKASSRHQRPPRPPVPPWAKRGRASAGPRPGR